MAGLSRRNLLGPLTREGVVSDPDARRLLWQIIIVALIVKIAFGIFLPMGADEAYATAVAREFSISFFDHPPISFWLPVIFAKLTGIEHPMIYRAPFLLIGVGTTLVLFLIGKEVSSNRAGLWTALLFSTSPFMLLSGSLFVVPDGPLYLATATAALFLVRIAKLNRDAPLQYWLFAGGALALALASKYHAAWFPVAILIYVILTPKARHWLVRPGLWLGGGIGLIGLLPVLIWNANHDWASFAFHSARASGGFSVAIFGVTFALQAIFLLPSGMFAAFMGLGMALKKRGGSPEFLLALIALGPILIFNYIYLTSGVTFAHWTMPGWIFALPLAGVWLDKSSVMRRAKFLGWTKILSLAFLVPITVLVIQANTGVLTRYIYKTPPSWDNTLVLSSLRGLKPALVKRGLWASTDVIMTNGWIPGGRIDTALASEKPMRIYKGIGAHHFAYISDAKATGRGLFMDISLVSKADMTGQTLLARARAIDPAARLLAPVILPRGGQDYVAISMVALTVR
ncbi:MAG: glycosyltransferase family 39 protein [Alphaproteobacteria bacterium]|nr:glycosyltransferase family 39 protein [Alphaproteobacteria bacterium]